MTSLDAPRSAPDIRDERRRRRVSGGCKRPSTPCWPRTTRRRPTRSSSAAPATTPGWPGCTSPRGSAGSACGPSSTGWSRSASASRARGPPTRARSSWRWPGRRSSPTAPTSRSGGFLRPMFTGEERWCQLFSEPGAGSDFAGLATRAVRDGDEWVVNGQKVWNTLAHLADWGMLVTRSRPRAAQAQGHDLLRPRHALARRRGAPAAPDHRRGRVQRGLPHRRAHPRRQPDRRRGRGLAGVADDADERALGDRSGAGPAAPRRGGAALRRRRRCGTTLPEYGAHGDARGPADAAVGRGRGRGGSRTCGPARARRAGNPGPEGRWPSSPCAELNKEVYDFCIDLLGADGHGRLRLHVPPTRGARRRPASSSGLRHAFLRVRANSIEGGTSEIMRNILGEQVLGLPGEPRVDKDSPGRRSRATDRRRSSTPLWR